MITVRLPEPLRDGGGELLTITEPVESLGDLIDVLERRVPSFTTERDELFNFAVNGELILHGEKNVALSSGDEIEVVVAFSGG
jgi:molybdopterin converting factor small subunit